MNPALRELYDQERGLEERAKTLIADPNATEGECNAMLAQLDAIKGKIAMAKVLDAPDTDGGKQLPGAHGNEPTYNAELFYKAVVGALSDDEKAVVAKAVREHKAALTGEKPEDGGYVVPKDFAEEIIKAIVDDESVRNLVRVEGVKTLSGGRVVQKGTPNRLFNTESRKEIELMNNPQFEMIGYTIRKFAGLMDVPRELLADSFVNFIAEMRTWLADAARETENVKVFYGGGTSDKDPVGILHQEGGNPYYIEIDAPAEMSIKAVRRMFNSLKKGYRKKAVWVTNTHGFELLSNIEDRNGRGILTPDPRNEDRFTLFGRPVEVYDTIETTEVNENKSTTIIMFGDFKRAYRMFDRKAFEFRITDTGAGAFETDTIKARGIARFDGQQMDGQALVIMRDVDVDSATPPTGDIGIDSATLTGTFDFVEVESQITEMVDAALAEVKTQADELIADAETKAKKLIADAEKDAQKLTADAKKASK